MNRLGLGYKPDKPDARDRPFAAHRLAAAPVAETSDLTGFASMVFDQGQTSSCVGHGWAQALFVDAAANGKPLPEYPSPLAIYRWARAEDGNDVDEGANIRSAAKAIAQLGIPPLSLWPEDFTRVNDGPPPGVYRAAYDNRGMRGYVRIANGDVDAMRRALSAGKPVVFGLELADGFFDYNGTGTIDVDKGAIVGGHCMAVLGHDPTRFRIVSSWGTGWGAQGFAWITSRRMTEATDCWIADFAEAA